MRIVCECLANIASDCAGRGEGEGYRYCPSRVVISVPGGGIVQATADFKNDEFTVAAEREGGCHYTAF